MKTTERSHVDLSGFIDRFEARNLAAIQRNIALQLSEMETRLGLMLEQVRGHNTLVPLFEAMSRALTTGDGSVVDRLLSVGERLTELFIKHAATIAADEKLKDQLPNFVRTYSEAAELSHNDRLIAGALGVVQAFEKSGLYN